MYNKTKSLVIQEYVDSNLIKTSNNQNFCTINDFILQFYLACSSLVHFKSQYFLKNNNLFSIFSKCSNIQLMNLRLDLCGFTL